MAANIGLVVLAAAGVWLLIQVVRLGQPTTVILLIMAIFIAVCVFCVWQPPEGRLSASSAFLRKLSAIDIGIKYLIAGGAIAVLALLAVQLQNSQRQREREEAAERARDRKLAEADRLWAEQQAIEKANSDAAVPYWTKALVVWARYDLLPEEERTKERAERAERAANEVVKDLTPKYRDELVGRNGRELKLRLKEIDERKTPSERAKVAIEWLQSEALDAREAACRAQNELDLISEKNRDLPIVRAAMLKIQAKKQTALRQQYEERMATRGLVCRDGWPSSCSCSGSHRGCCSSHGGVAGCSEVAVEKELDCASSK